MWMWKRSSSSSSTRIGNFGLATMILVSYCRGGGRRPIQHSMVANSLSTSSTTTTTLGRPSRSAPSRQFPQILMSGVVSGGGDGGGDDCGDDDSLPATASNAAAAAAAATTAATPIQHDDATEDLEDHRLSLSSSSSPFSQDNLAIYHLRRTVDSTQDEAKRLLAWHRPTTTTTALLAVIADRQRKGRGTSGRSWVASEGNLFLTCAIPRSLIPMSKITWLPLGVGVLIAEALDRRYPTLACRPVVKWPNDVLLDGKKIAGTLIESYQNNGQNSGSGGGGGDDYWLVGIGINVQSHPASLPTESKDFRAIPRAATSVREYTTSSSSSSSSPASSSDDDDISALDLGVDLTIRLQEWTNDLANNNVDASEFIARWKRWSELGVEYEIRETGEKVMIVDIANDGQLCVIDADGNQRFLIADYFY